MKFKTCIVEGGGNRFEKMIKEMHKCVLCGIWYKGFCCPECSRDRGY